MCAEPGSQSAMPLILAMASGSLCLLSGLPLETYGAGVPSKATSLAGVVGGFMGASLCSVLMPPSIASGHSKSNEDLKQQNSELEEKLRLLVIEKSAMQLGVEELQKKLEMSELLLQQVGLKPWGVRVPPGRARASQGHCGAL